MTEHAAVIFVFFFLAEYGSMLLICILTSILFLGGYVFMPISINSDILHIMDINFGYEVFLYSSLKKDLLLHNSLIEGMLHGLILGFKTCILVFVFI